MGYRSDEDKKKMESAELLADAEWFVQRMVTLVDELKTAKKGRQAQYLRECLTSAMTMHANCTRIAGGEDF